MGFGRAVALVVMALVAYRSFWVGQPYPLVQGINLVFHEAGHVFFAPFADPWPIAGGSLFEIALPATLALIAFSQLHWTAMGACLVWMGTACQSVSVYAGDAQARALPLVGGEAVIHDWWYILSTRNALDRTAEIAAKFWTAGAIAASVGLICLVLGVIRGNDTRAIR